MRIGKLIGIVIVSGLAAVPSRAAEFGLGTWDVRAGVAIPSDWDTGYSVGLSVDIGGLARGLHLYPGLRYSRAEETSDFFGTEIGLEVTDLAVGAEVRYFLDRGQSGWYFGAGAYLHLLEYEQRVGSGSASVDTERLGPAGVAGYRWDTGGMAFLLEARVDSADVFDRGEVLIGLSFGGE